MESLFVGFGILKFVSHKVTECATSKESMGLYYDFARSSLTNSEKSNWMMISFLELLIILNFEDEYSGEYVSRYVLETFAVNFSRPLHCR